MDYFPVDLTNDFEESKVYSLNFTATILLWRHDFAGYHFSYWSLNVNNPQKSKIMCYPNLTES